MNDINQEKLIEGLKLLQGNYDLSESPNISNVVSSSISMETIAGFVLGTIMFSVGVFLVKTGTRDGMLVKIISGVSLCVIPFFIVDPYILTGVGIVCFTAIKYIDY